MTEKEFAKFQKFSDAYGQLIRDFPRLAEQITKSPSIAEKLLLIDNPLAEEAFDALITEYYQLASNCRMTMEKLKGILDILNDH